MVLTICVFSFLSLVSPTPDYETCYRATDAQLKVVVGRCEALNHDPLSTCDIKRLSATRYYVYVRTIGGGRDEAPAPVSHKEES